MPVFQIVSESHSMGQNQYPSHCPISFCCSIWHPKLTSLDNADAICTYCCEKWSYAGCTWHINRWLLAVELFFWGTLTLHKRRTSNKYFLLSSIEDYTSTQVGGLWHTKGRSSSSSYVITFTQVCGKNCVIFFLGSLTSIQDVLPQCTLAKVGNCLPLAFHHDHDQHHVGTVAVTATLQGEY